MRRTILIMLCLATALCADRALAETHLEASLAFSPTVVTDPGYEAFSVDDAVAGRFGLDLRAEVASLDGFKIVPLIGYRAALDSGSPYSLIDTELVTHDIFAGLRVRKGLTSWLGVFVEASGGLVVVDMDGETGQAGGLPLGYDHGSSGPERTAYDDRQLTWSVGGIGGLALYVSPAYMRSKGIERFNVGAEVGAGYIRRGAVAFSPTLEEGDEHSLPTDETDSWGEVNLSGWMIQLGVTVRFL